MTSCSFNVNHNATIVLTDIGKDLLPEYYKSKINEDNSIDLPLWEIMNIFGESMRMGRQIPFETEIKLINISDVKEI